MNILLIDDNQHDAFLLREALSDVKSAPLQLHHADRLSGGFSRLAAGDIDALLLDLNLPDSSGLDTLEQVCERHPEVPIVILTGMDDERLAMLGVQKGAQDYLVKGTDAGAMIYRSVCYAVERKRFLTELEARVQERTTELTAANRALQREITERKETDEALRTMVEGVVALTGEDFFSSLVRHLATSLHVQYAYVSELSQDRTHCQSVAGWGRGTALPPFQVPAGGPCEAVLTGQAVHHPDQLPKIYPDIRVIADWGAVSYCGVPVVDRSEQVIGHVAILDDKPMPDARLATAILQVFAARVAAELTRTRAEESLRKSEGRTRAIVESALDGVVTMDARGVITSWNTQAERIFGHPAVETIGRTLSSTIIPPRYREAHQRGLERFLSSGESSLLGKRIEVMALHRDGREFPVELAVSAVKVSEDILFSAFVRDLTERKRVEAALELAKFSTERAVDAMYWIGPQANIMDVNEAACAMLGYSKAELTALTVHDINPDFPAEKWPDFWAQTKESGSASIEIRHRAKDGRIIPVEVSVNYLDYDGKEYHCAFVRDITTRKQAEEALRESERRFRILYDETPSMHFTVDAQGIVRSVNQYGAQYLGYAVENLVGKPVTDIFVEEDRRLVQDRMRALLAHPRAVDAWEFRKVRADGAVMWVHEIARVIQDSDGEPLALIVCEDITARKAAATEKALLEERLRQSEKMECIGSLAGGIAHDFNNLLTVISGYAQMGLTETAPLDKTYKRFKEIAASAERATGLTKQLLAFSRKQILQPTRLVLNDVIADTETLLKRLISEHVILHVSYAPEPVAIQADRTQLEQVLINLAVNARDAMPTGGRLLIRMGRTILSAGDSEARGIIPPGRYATLDVTDTGCGMDVATKARVFEPFFTTKKPGDGTGLGLATVYGIVKQTGGYIFIESEPGQGTSCTLYFPEIDAQASRDAIDSATATPANPVFKSNGVTALVLDDELSIRRLIHQVLESNGYQALSAGDGETGLKVAESHPKPIDVLVTDVVMPRLNGAETAKRLLKKHPRLKVLYISGYADDTIRHHGVVQSEGAFLAKPFQPHVLLERLNEILGVPARAE